MALTEYFSRIEILEPLRAPDKLVAGKATVSVLHAKKDVDRILQSAVRDQFRGVPIVIEV